VNLLDVVLVGLAVAAAVGGFRLGFLARASSWLGMALGSLLAARLTPTIVDRLGEADAANLLLVVAVVLLAGALIGQLVGLAAGSRLRLAVPRGRAQTLDRALGAAAGAAGVVLAIWLLLPVTTSLRDWPARQAETSAIANLVEARLPEPPDALAGLATLVGPLRWDEVLGALRVEGDVDPPPVASSLPGVVASAAAASAVTVRGPAPACGSGRQGSGFVLDDAGVLPRGRLVVTNAHVVAGVSRLEVVDHRREEYDARLVAFDSHRDLAVLAVADLEVPALPIGAAEPGDTGGVFGHPRGGPLEVSPYHIDHRERVRVPDLYATGDAIEEAYIRSIFVLGAALEQGDSGAPLVNQDGQVVGVAFATTQQEASQVAFALTGEELDTVVDAALEVLAAAPDHAEPTPACLPESVLTGPSR
jgi:S1-C subfamily serine protease